MLVGLLAAPGAAAESAPAAVSGSAPADEYLWLEEVEGQRALEWVRARNAENTTELASSEAFGALERRFRDILDSDARIPFIDKQGPHYYNFWRDRQHVQIGRASCRERV